MKIGIITVSKVKNYGSALLCYATQELFSQAGFDKVEFIDYKRGRLEAADNIKGFYQGLKDSTKHNLCMGNIIKECLCHTFSFKLLFECFFPAPLFNHFFFILI